MAQESVLQYSLQVEVFGNLSYQGTEATEAYAKYTYKHTQCALPLGKGHKYGVRYIHTLWVDVHCNYPPNTNLKVPNFQLVRRKRSKRLSQK